MKKIYSIVICFIAVLSCASTWAAAASRVTLLVRVRLAWQTAAASASAQWSGLGS